jgi:hypothetical protein
MRNTQHVTRNKKQTMNCLDAVTESQLLRRAAAPVEQPQLLAYNPYGGHCVRPADDPPFVESANHNAEDRFELFLLDDGQSKVEHKEETRKLRPRPLCLLILTQQNE